MSSTKAWCDFHQIAHHRVSGLFPCRTVRGVTGVYACRSLKCEHCLQPSFHIHYYIIKHNKSVRYRKSVGLTLAVRTLRYISMTQIAWRADFESTHMRGKRPQPAMFPHKLIDKSCCEVVHLKITRQLRFSESLSLPTNHLRVWLSVVY